MNDDLISRKAVIDYLREQNNNVIIEKYKDGFVSEDTCTGMESAISAFRNFILTLPTAFDKEKVIKELKSKAEISKKRKEFFIEKGFTQEECLLDGRERAYKKAIEIVEKGGI